MVQTSAAPPSGPGADDSGPDATTPLDERIRALAHAHRRLLGGRPPPLDRLLDALESRYRTLYRRITRRVAAGSRGSRAEEWLLDNSHVVQQALKQVRDGLPKRYLAELPQVDDGHGRPTLRVRRLARALVDGTAQPIDIAQVVEQVGLYQQVCELTLGEIWALPAAFRWVLLDTLIDAAERAIAGGDNGNDDTAGMGVVGAIVGLRAFETSDWRDSAQALMPVERILREDPAQAYPRMTFATRDRYRKAVEVLARRTRVAETQVARVALQCAREAATDSRRGHVGYYLIDAGRAALARRLGRGLHRPWREPSHATATGLYFAGLALLSLPPWLALGTFVAGHGASAGLTALVMVLAGVPLFGLAVALLNGLITHCLAPRQLPRLDFSDGIPNAYRSAVAVPVLLGGVDDVASLLERLEINYLNNEDRNLVYVLLGDCADAPQREHADDAAILDAACAGLGALNARYARDADDTGPFVFLHRRREWNPAQGCWMGWERKRGKLLQFNRLLTGDDRGHFDVMAGDRRLIDTIRYVITLDADTAMPPGTAGALIGCMAHPLNHAEIDTARGRVTRGYAFLQPRLDIDPDTTAQTRFAQIFAGDVTVDLYTHAVSDAYQDLFGEGIFAGKGIYDPHAVERTLDDRIPANALLSHDLLEGSFGRTALVSDTRFYEQFPPNVFAYLRRAHRWIRGDWQLLPWLWRRVPTSRAIRERNPLSLIQQWQIVDNLRRSLTPPATLALLGLAWSGALPGAAWAWTLAILALTAVPIWIELLTLFWRCAADWRQTWRHLRATPALLRQRARRWLLSLCLLPYESQLVIDGVARTLYRMRVSRRHLLDWRSARQVDRALGQGLTPARAWRQMWISPVLAIVAAVGLGLDAPAALAPAAPLLLAWLLAPPLASWISRVAPQPAPELSAAQQQTLRNVARRTWYFFERFMGPDDHWLPPDNFQEEPRVALARRTSPTNIGMGLLSQLAAHDLGYIDVFSLAARLASSFDRIQTLEHYRGHLLNWYETRELRSLTPRYVSTVDNGNLAASLITLARGLEQLSAAPVAPHRLLAGVRDTLSVLAATLDDADAQRQSPAEREWLDALAKRRHAIDAVASDAEGWALLQRFHDQDLPALQTRLLALVEHADHRLSMEQLRQLHHWQGELKRQVALALRYGERLLCWRDVLHAAPAAWRDDRAANAPLARAYRGLRERLDGAVTLDDCIDIKARAQAPLARIEAVLEAAGDDRAARDWSRRLAAALATTAQAAAEVRDELRALIAQADAAVAAMDFGFLYDPARHLFRIGYNVDEARLDSGYYDLLASEARLTGFVAIAKGDVPARHWLHLGRPFRRVRGHVALMSWGATLFEYLMPSLLMPTPAGSLLDRACRSAIAVQTAFVAPLKLPWGLSESGYYQLDAQSNYQYRAFGVPGLGFRRDLGERLVVSPYACLLALAFDPPAVLRNLERLRRAGALGHYGFYEAVDYGATARPGPRRARLVRSYMSHHQGMLLLAIDNALNDRAMPARLQSDPRIARLANLLYERFPAQPPALQSWPRTHWRRPFATAMPLVAWQPDTDRPIREYNLLSNGHISLLEGADGGGGSHWQHTVLTRGSADATRDTQGHWHYIKDLHNGTLTSVGREPTDGDVDGCRTLFAPHYVEHQRRAPGLFCRLRIALASQHDVEVRHLVVKNETHHRRRLLIGACAEVVLAGEADDLRHPAFAKLFVESRYVGTDTLMLYRRRPRAASEKALYLAHAVSVPAEVEHDVVWETDRARFLGRWGHPGAPRALASAAGFTNTTGAVLDPVMATGVELTLAPHAEVDITYTTAVGHTRRQVIDTMRNYRRPARAQWVFEQARMAAEQELAELRIAPGAVAWMMRLLSAVLVPCRALRAAPATLARGDRIQSALWGRGISGDHPILLARIHAADDAEFARALLQAHALWGGRGRAVDLVFVDESPGGYVQPGRDRLQQLTAEVRGSTQRPLVGDVHVVAAAELAEHDRLQLWAAARVVLDAAAGPIEAQLDVATTDAPALPPFVAIGPPAEQRPATPALARPRDLEFDNGLGGFADDGREYVIHLEHGRRPPAPWSNIIANPDFGCLCTEAGLGCSWAGNSGENRLTPWANDPVRDPASEAIYLRDEETADVWTPTPMPRPADGAYQIRHGAGYTLYRHHSHGVEQSLRVTVDRDAPVKILHLRLRNRWPWTRRLTATYYAEWVLGTTRTATAPHLVVDHDPGCGALLARNAFVRDAEPGVAFVVASERAHGLTADRTEFLGRSGGLDAPAALFRIGLSGRVETGRDPCAAYQVHVDLPAEACRDVYFILGQGRDRDDAIALATRFGAHGAAAEAETGLARFWEAHLARVQIHTPDRATDIMVNRWLPYQALSCRFWARTGYYQSSGAYGFRDQLQDVLALLWSRPEWTRAHILRSAARQFPAGDVLHWWHERPLRGVRTRCSDDLLWLPYVVAQYVEATGDDAILDEAVPYLSGAPLETGETERYAEYADDPAQGALYEHCARAIEHAARVGPHGLPVIGSGDWNDGFNRVSTTGRGESVWLAWFIIRVCRDFAPLCRARGDDERARHYLGLAAEFEQRVEASAWDGAWYRRAYFDDGTPLGSATNDECQIDLMAQTWAALATGPGNARAVQAMNAACQRLVRDDARQILLLAPPFDRSPMDPGYIKGYPPGIRENGGQYTHGATWAVWAAAALGDGERAWHLFSLLNPVHQAHDAAGIARYRTEPYVLAGDVYGVAPHVGRGGWTWYSGAAGWLYRGALEALLGLCLHGGDSLEIAPCLPASWTTFGVTLHRGASRYDIVVEIVPDAAAAQLTMDGEPVAGTRLPLIDDGRDHQVRARVAGHGRRGDPAPTRQTR